GLIGPGLFDGYHGFCPRPALLLGLSVVRRPARGVATLLGGGWVASGVPGADRLPTIHHPPGLRFAPQEAAGEVQTPVTAKAGEPAEHALDYQLLSGGEVVAAAPTYRGEGRLFL